MKNVTDDSDDDLVDNNGAEDCPDNSDDDLVDNNSAEDCPDDSDDDLVDNNGAEDCPLRFPGAIQRILLCFKL